MCSRARALRSETSSRRWASITDRDRSPAAHQSATSRPRERSGVSSITDAVMLLIERDRGFGAAVAEVLERRAFPRVDLAVVLGQLDGEPALDEAAKRASRLELGQLTVVADEHQLAADRRGRLHELGELSRREHPGLIDHEHAPLRQRARPAALQVAEQRGDARTRDPRILLELPRGATRDRHPEHGQPGRLPRLTRRGERERLAGPRLADHHAHAVAAQAQALDHRALLAREGRPRGDCSFHRPLRHKPGASAARDADLVDESLLEREQLRCRVDELVALDREQPAITAPIGVALAAIGQQRDRMGGADEAIRCRLDRPRHRGERRRGRARRGPG